jgi:hypothetical protein
VLFEKGEWLFRDEPNDRVVIATLMRLDAVVQSVFSAELRGHERHSSPPGLPSL